MLQPNHPWLKTSPGVYTQTHDSFQQFFSDWISSEESNERTTLIVTSCIRISAYFRSFSRAHVRLPAEEEIEAILRKAWLSVRIHNPGLAVQVNRHCSTYVVSSEKDLKAWVEKTFLVHRDISARDLIRALYRERSFL